MKNLIVDAVITIVIFLCVSFVWDFFFKPASDNSGNNSQNVEQAEAPPPPAPEPVKITNWALNDPELFIVTIDSCQYLFIRSFKTLAHKGNCTNSFHRLPPIQPSLPKSP